MGERGGREREGEKGERKGGVRNEVGIRKDKRRGRGPRGRKEQREMCVLENNIGYGCECLP